MKKPGSGSYHLESSSKHWAEFHGNWNEEWDVSKQLFGNFLILVAKESGVHL